ncbi:MAG: hypothetical protein EA403_01495 [Spirochaetaceae bacterium]|nr:MAG: hypothetical protein EA403_01495 [Spirochaetaceae bacterium]
MTNPVIYIKNNLLTLKVRKNPNSTEACVFLFTNGSGERRASRIPTIAFGILFLSLAAGLCAQEVLRVSGATTIQPAAERAAAIFSDIVGGTVLVQGGGSGAGIRDTRAGTSAVGMVSRALTPAELSDLIAITYGFDALVFIVNRANPLDEISLADVRRLYSGQVRTWDALGGWDQAVVLVNKEIGRATLDLFEGYSGVAHPNRPQAGPAGRVDPGAYEIASNLEAMTLVGGIPGAIGYVSMGAAESLIDAGMPIKVLRLDGVRASAATLADGSYPILRELNLVVREETERTRAYTDLFFGPDIRSFIQASGVVPADR